MVELIPKEKQTSNPKAIIEDRLKTAYMQLHNDMTFFWGILSRLIKKEDNTLPAPMGVDESALTLYYNPEHMSEHLDYYTIPTIKYIYMHETLHVELMHGLRRSIRDPRIWNIACDIAINSILTDVLGLPLPEGALYDRRFSGKTAEAIYEILIKKAQKTTHHPVNQPPRKRGRGGGGGGGWEPGRPGGGGGHGKPVAGKDIKINDDPNKPDVEVEITLEDGTKISGKIPKSDLLTQPHQVTEGQKNTIEQEIKQITQIAKEMHEQQNRIRQQGVSPGQIEELIKLTEPKVDWRKMLAFYLRTIYEQEDYTWTRPSRRIYGAPYTTPEGRVEYPYLPGRLSEEYELRVAIGIDTSGSISDQELVTFMSETLGILNQIPGDVTALVIQTDSEVYSAVEYHKGEMPPEIQVTGRGGSDTSPTFETIEELNWQPDVLVYFTDLEVTFPSEAPPYPVLWITIGEKTTAPFGDVAKYDSLI